MALCPLAPTPGVFLGGIKGEPKARGLQPRRRAVHSSHSISRDEETGDQGHGWPRSGHRQYDPPHRNAADELSPETERGSGCTRGWEWPGRRAVRAGAGGGGQAGRGHPGGAWTHGVHGCSDVQVDPNPRPVKANV